MKRVTISLPEAVAEAARLEARRRGVSVAEITRQALVVFLKIDDEPRRIPFASLGRSGYRNTARDIRKILREEWGRNPQRLMYGE
jgi:hypothetical protein